MTNLLAEWGSWILFGISCCGLWLQGQNPKLAWWYAIANQSIWIAYAVVTAQHGLIATSVVFACLYARNLWRWRNTPMPRPGKQPSQPERCCCERVAEHAAA